MLSAFHIFNFIMSFGSWRWPFLGSLGQWWVLRAGEGQVCIFASEATSKLSLELWNNKSLFGVCLMSNIIQSWWESACFPFQLLLFLRATELPGEGPCSGLACFFHQPLQLTHGATCDYDLNSQDKRELISGERMIDSWKCLLRVGLFTLGSYSCLRIKS